MTFVELMFRKIRRAGKAGSLRTQLLTRSLLLLLAILIGVGILQYVYMERFLYQNKADAIRRQIMSTPGDLWQRFSEGKRRGRESPVFIFPLSSVLYRDANGTMTELSPHPEGGSAPLLDDETYDRAVLKGQNDGGRPVYRIMDDDRGVSQLVVVQAVRVFPNGRGVVQVSTDIGPLRAEANRQIALYGGIALFALLLGWLLFRPVIRRTLVPLSKVTDTMERIDSGRLSERLPEQYGQAEIDRLAYSFNLMLERLELSFRAEREAKEQMRRFVADASHELRTPLTSIHGFLEVLLRGASRQPEQLEQSLQRMFGESKRLGKLVNDLLLLARLDRAPELEKTETDLNGMLQEMEPQLRMLAQKRNVRFDLLPVPRFAIDTDKMKQVVLNLFQNAVQHTDAANGSIAVGTSFEDGTVRLTVADNGAGIPESHLPHIFDRFYRIDGARSRQHGGTGLGLAISRSIVESHGGKIAVESAMSKGSTFRIVLPV